MFIPISTTIDNAIIEPTSNRVTLALIGDMSSVTVTLQQDDGAGGWNPVVILGETQVLDANNTLLATYAPIKLNVNKSAGSNCGVAIYVEK